MKRGSVVVALLLGHVSVVLGTSSARAEDPVRVSDPGIATTMIDAATDREGDTVIASVEQRVEGNTYSFQMVRSDGSRGWATSMDVPDLWAQLHVAVDDDGDGIVVWDFIDEFTDDLHSELYARRFSRDGEFGPVVVIDADSYSFDDVGVAVRPRGTAIVTWPAETDRGLRTRVATIDRSGRLGPTLLVGREDLEPQLAVERSGRATLVWSNGRHVYARRLRTDGTLSRTRLIRREGYPEEKIDVEDVAVDRRGAVTAACHRSTRNTAFPGQLSNSYERPCLFDTTPRLRLRREVRHIAPRAQTQDHVVVGMAASGRGVVAWQRNYYEGAFVRTIRADGSLGKIRRIGTGGLGEITLRPDGNGYAASTSLSSGGVHRIIRLTRIRDARFGVTRTVHTSGAAVDAVLAGTGATGSSFLTWTDYTTGTPEVLTVQAR